MKTASNSRVLRTIPLLIVVCVLLSGCLEFETIDQPSSVLPDEVFTVLIEATVEFALRDQELKDPFSKYLKKIVSELP